MKLSRRQFVKATSALIGSIAVAAKSTPVLYATIMEQAGCVFWKVECDNAHEIMLEFWDRTHTQTWINPDFRFDSAILPVSFNCDTESARRMLEAARFIIEKHNIQVVK